MEGVLALAKLLVGGIVAHATLSDLAMALAGLFVFSAAVQRLTSKGPMLWPVLGIIPTLFLHVHHVYDWATECLLRSGGTFAYRGMWMGGARGVVTVDPANIRHMLRTNFANFPKGKYYRERFSDLLGDGIFNADDEKWREQRRAAASEMHSSRFVAYSAETMATLVHEKLLKLIESLLVEQSPGGGGRVIDLQDVFLRFTFDNICTAAFGVDPGCLGIDLPQVPFAKAFEEATELTLFRFVVPPFVWKVMKLLDIGSEWQLRQAVRVVHEFAEKTVAIRRAEWAKLGSLNDRSDLLSRLITEAEDIGTGSQFSDKFLKDFCISFILAGRDTSSVALTWFFWLLHQHPEVEMKIIAEIEKIVNDKLQVGEGGNRSDFVFGVKELKRMDYLQAALLESLRLYPSVPIDFKEALEDDIFPDGTIVKKGDRVIYFIFSMARCEAIWGKDCMEFRPERWMTEDGRFAGEESQFKYPVFNAGPRLCMGKKFAYMQMKMVAASILMRYSLEVVDSHLVAPKMTTTLYMKNGLMVKFKRRAEG